MPRGKKEEWEGELKDMQGRAERQAGEWSGDDKQKARGAAKQAEGKTEKVVGKIKNKVQKVRKNLDKAA
ncbi:MAG: hypothetical protein ACRD0Y_03630 [Terriglobales bacterium]